jgi:nicotinate-nucleotide pyrophosphorylase (carboxylating)
MSAAGGAMSAGAAGESRARTRGEGPDASIARAAGLPARGQLRELVRRALAEDVGSGDVTTEAIVPCEARARAFVTQKAEGVIFGIELVELTIAELDPQAVLAWRAQEGEWREQGERVLELEGRARALLTGERTALNFLAHLSGIATAAARAARETRGTGASVLDTRKTIPGLRALEKAAVAAGGAHNHRYGLYDAILIKDNHIAIAGGVGPAIELARAAAPELADTLEVEVRNAREVDEALAAGAPRLLLDNMDEGELRAAVAQVGGRAQLEASGNVTLQTLRGRAQTGVDWISMGALTHSASALDVSLSMEVLP